jgi:hypothetical protein
MKKIFLVLGVLLAASLPLAAMGQGVIPLAPGGDVMPGFGPGMPGPGLGMPGPGMGMPGPGMPWMGWGGRQRFPDEMWRVNTWARTGPIWFNWTFDAPYNIPGQTIVDTEGVNPALVVTLPNFNFESIRLSMAPEPYWVGFAGVELQPAPDVIVYGELGGNLQRDGADVWMDASGLAFIPDDFSNGLEGPGPPPLNVSFASALRSPPNTTSPWIWKTKNFQWWMIDAGAAYMLNSVIGVEAGFRVEHFDFKLVDPRNFTTPVPGLSNNASGIPRPITRAIVCSRI